MSIAITSQPRLPALFVAHGAPTLLEDPGWVGELRAWAARLPRPEAVLVISAHWESRPVAIGATTTVPLVYDFHGFEKRHYEVTYPAPGAPGLAARVRAILGAGNCADEPARGLDHGAYVPLVAMYSSADVPVLQLSLPSEDARENFELGRALRLLRDEGILIVGSGFITHNLRTVAWNGNPPPRWAVEFDEWTARALERRDVDALLDCEREAPAVRTALPTREHFIPLLAALGASRDDDPVSFPITGFWMSSLTRRSVQFG